MIIIIALPLGAGFGFGKDVNIGLSLTGIYCGTKERDVMVDSSKENADFGSRSCLPYGGVYPPNNEICTKE